MKLPKILSGQPRSPRLELTLPGYHEPELAKPFSLRVMSVGSLRSYAYGLIAANVIFTLSAALVGAAWSQRLTVTPYIADGSSFGCRPAEIEPAATEGGQ